LTSTTFAAVRADRGSPSFGTPSLSIFFSGLAILFLFRVITGNIGQSARRLYLIYSEADFEVFRPAGATRCTDGVKFGTEEGTFKFHPIGAMVRVQDP